MQPDERPKMAPREKAGLASLANVSLRRSPDARDKKSDITETLATMRAAPRYLAADANVDREEMRDVTPPGSADIVTYWNKLRALRPMPVRDDLRISDIAPRWPSLILFRCGPSDCLRPDSTFATALRAYRGPNGSSVFEGGAEISALLSQWILSVARKTAAEASPCRDKSSFDAPGGRRIFELVGVPFGDDDVDHVLCSVDGAETAT